MHERLQQPAWTRLSVFQSNFSSDRHLQGKQTLQQRKCMKSRRRFDSCRLDHWKSGCLMKFKCILSFCPHFILSWFRSVFRCFALCQYCLVFLTGVRRADFPTDCESSSWYAFWSSDYPMALGLLESNPLTGVQLRENWNDRQDSINTYTVYKY